MITHDWTCSHSRAIRLQQKGALWMKDVIRKFTTPVKAIVDIRPGTFATWKAFMLFPRHGHFTSCAIETIRFRELLLGAVGVFLRQTLN